VTAQAIPFTGDSIAELQKQLAQARKQAEATDKLLKELQQANNDKNNDKVSVHTVYALYTH
jgi:hypothetical protein